MNEKQDEILFKVLLRVKKEGNLFYPSAPDSDEEVEIFSINHNTETIYEQVLKIIDSEKLVQYITKEPYKISYYDKTSNSDKQGPIFPDTNLEITELGLSKLEELSQIYDR